MTDPLNRFAEQTALTDSGCIEWTACLSKNGYGRIYVDGALLYAHRWSYEHHVGPIPSGHHIDHLCRNRACVNPTHLEAVTPRENLLRGVGPTATNAAKTHCPAGHAYEGSNLYIERRGGRQCRACKRERMRLFRLRKKATQANPRKAA